jgi:hypothetical protein
MTTRASFGEWLQREPKALTGEAPLHRIHRRVAVLILGLILLLIGFITGSGILQTLGIILLVVGASCGSWDRWGVRLAAVGTPGSAVDNHPSDHDVVPTWPG